MGAIILSNGSVSFSTLVFILSDVIFVLYPHDLSCEVIVVVTSSPYSTFYRRIGVFAIATLAHYHAVFAFSHPKSFAHLTASTVERVYNPQLQTVNNRVVGFVTHVENDEYAAMQRTCIYIFYLDIAIRELHLFGSASCTVVAEDALVVLIIYGVASLV